MLSGIMQTQVVSGLNTAGSNLSIDSDASFAATSGTNIAIGAEAMGGGSLGDCDNNIAVGTNALTNLSTGDYNIAIGSSAGEAMTSNNANIAIGYKALTSIDSGEHYNVAIGHEAMKNVDDPNADYNVVIGFQALEGGGDTGGYNTVIGSMAGDAGSNVVDNAVIIGAQAGRGDLHANADGTVLIGKGAGAALTQPDANGANLAIGYSAMAVHTTGSRNIAIGYEAMHDTNADSDSMGSNDNVFLGYSAGGGEWQAGESSHNIGIGSYVLNAAMKGSIGNIGIGYEALNDIQEGDYNICIGFNSGDKIVDNSKNVAVGAYTLGQNGADNNVAIGYGAGGACDDDDNVYVGYKAGEVNTGTRNIVIGSAALASATAMDKVTVIGQDALFSANNNAANGAIAIGWRAGYYSVPTGTATTAGNTIIGYEAGTDTGNETGLTTGIQNTVVGHQAFGANCGANITGNDNTVIGFKSGWTLNTSASNNTFMGTQSGVQVTTGNYNTAIGWKALAYDGSSSLTGNSNVCVGFYSGRKLEGGAAENVFIGSYAGDACTTGDANTAIGYASDVSALVNNQIAIGRASITSAADCIAIGCDITNSTTRTVKFGDSGHSMISQDWDSSGDSTWTRSSDRRRKTNIKDNHFGLDFIKRLKTRTFTIKPQNELPKEWEAYSETNRFDTEKLHVGFIAQELKELADEFNLPYEVISWSEDPDGMQRAGETKLITPLIKAVQELAQQIEDLKKG